MAAAPRSFAASILTVAALWVFTACTVKPARLPPGTMPATWNPTAAEAEFGSKLFQDLCKDYTLNSDEQQAAKLTTVFHRVAGGANVNVVPWHLHLFNEPEMVDIRAVHGNYIFVWSGLLDIVGSPDELAGLLAWEMAHALARHTEPVQYTLGTEIAFRVAELATSFGVMMLTQGIVSIGGAGWMQWAYTEAMDLDPLDRVYGEDEEREAAALALLMVEQARYAAAALLSFWQRVQRDPALGEKCKRLARKLSPEKRVALLEQLLPGMSPRARSSSSVASSDTMR